MRALVVRRYGPPNVFELQQLPDPQPKAGEVLIRVKTIGVNFADLMQRMGIYPGSPKPPFVPGLEIAGVVEKIAEGGKPVEGEPLRPGDAVMAFPEFRRVRRMGRRARDAGPPLAARHALRGWRCNPRELPDRVSRDVHDGQSAARRPHRDPRRCRWRGNRRRATRAHPRPGHLWDCGTEPNRNFSARSAWIMRSTTKRAISWRSCTNTRLMASRW